MPKPTLTPKNRTILNTALRAMLAMPETYDQREYLLHDNAARPSKKRPAPYCGTVGCIAGHLALATGLPPTADQFRVCNAATKIVGRYGASTLFSAELDFWPERFRRGWSRLTRADKAARAVARVRFWMRTGE